MNISSNNEFLEFNRTQEMKPFHLAFRAEFSITLTVLSYMWLAIFPLGIASNIVNIVTFLKAGANDNVTILLIALSCSDLTFLLLVSPTMSRFVIGALVKPRQWPFDYNILAFLLIWPANTAYDISCFLAVSLGVMRCACVAMPLKFKLVFTKSRTIKWSLLLVVLAVFLRLPVLTIFRLAWRTDPATNVSTIYLASSPNKVLMMRFNDILNRGIVVYIAYIIMITCVVVISFKLYQASNLRKNCVAQSAKLSDQASDKNVVRGLSTRDVQVVKSVVLVCSVFILAQLPYVLSSLIQVINPEFDEGKSLSLLRYLFNQVSITCYYINASVNIFIHYNFNTKYRSVFRSQLLHLEPSET
ncbi:chemosensory receptor A [Elysia marginata]|uniref:Chemosensory receptor A n=1 Tax=Elysia marginata TaxID=1093978 RepID=A0AAV4I194_9GAST|nr:chemosensory receptor A [Elysia marginata]